jgi:hypothetical protein
LLRIGRIRIGLIRVGRVGVRLIRVRLIRVRLVRVGLLGGRLLGRTGVALGASAAASGTFLPGAAVARRADPAGPARPALAPARGGLPAA